METLGHILKIFLKDLGIEKPIKRYEAIEVWNQVVGKRISDVTEPKRMTDGKLFVKVKNDTWRNELTYHKHKIIKKINNKIGTRVLEDIILI